MSPLNDLLELNASAMPAKHSHMLKGTRTSLTFRDLEDFEDDKERGLRTQADLIGMRIEV